MITSAKPSRQDVSARPNEQFLEMLPKIRKRACRAFCRARPERKAELIQEVIANSYCAFAALVRDGKTQAAYATPLANFAIRQVISGRQVGTKRRLRDVLSERRFQPASIVVERLDRFDETEGAWKEALLVDRRATPAEMAIARIDVAAWLDSLSPRNRQIAKFLAMGETTGNAAQQYGLSSARISQLRKLLEASWLRFQVNVSTRIPE
jgi:DNA-binding NarL/FixJ family response regulator